MQLQYPPLSLCIAFILLISKHSASNVAELGEDIDGKLPKYEVALIKFGASWCHFSTQLEPIFEEVGEKFTELTQHSKVLIGSVECTKYPGVCSKHRVTKYPTLKLFLNGADTKREHRGERTVDLIAAFVNAELVDHFKPFVGEGGPIMEASKLLKDDSAAVIGWFPSTSDSNLADFKKVAQMMYEQCNFYLAENLSDPDDSLAFRDVGATSFKEVTRLRNANFLAINTWIAKHCTSVVRELTFGNAEALTEERLPFVILFYEPSEEKTKDSKILTKHRYINTVKGFMMEEKEKVNFLVADGNKFSHPLKHLGKTKADLPLIAIDSFEHMYLFPVPVEDAFAYPEKFKQFIADLHSGKLHREFHYPPPPPAAQVEGGTPASEESGSGGGGKDEKEEDKQQTNDTKPKAGPTTPPLSVFKHLKPSKSRYSVPNDEL